jgi:general secretion pathway protein G
VLARLQAKKNDEGFTLVEMLIVIVVLGILAGIAVFGVAQFRSDASAASCNATKKTVETAADAYNAKNGAYPASLQLLVNEGYLKSNTVPNDVTLTGGVAGGTCDSATKLVKP